MRYELDDRPSGGPTPSEALDMALSHLRRLCGCNVDYHAMKDSDRYTGRQGAEMFPLWMAAADARCDAHGQNRLHRCHCPRKDVFTVEALMEPEDPATCEWCERKDRPSDGTASAEVDDLDVEVAAWRALAVARALFIAAGKHPYAEEVFSIIDGGAGELLSAELISVLEDGWTVKEGIRTRFAGKAEGGGALFAEAPYRWEGFSWDTTRKALDATMPVLERCVEFDYLVARDGQTVVPTNLRSLVAKDCLDDERVLRWTVGARLGEGYMPGKRVGW